MPETIITNERENYAQWRAPKHQDKATRLRGKLTVTENVDTSLFTLRKKPQEVYVAKKQTKETGGSQAFRLEYGPETPRQAIIDDVATYLGEYRLQASETFYKLRFSREDDGLHIRDMYRGVAMVDTAKRSIARGDKLSRRKAEHVALQKEDELLAKAEDGDILIQLSPPGKKIADAGNYGFIFITKVEKVGDEERILNKNAIRINNATIEQYNQVLADITGKDIHHTSAEDLIADPHYLGKSITYKEIQTKLSQTFNFQPSTQERIRNEWILTQAKPYIDHFTDMVQNGTPVDEAFAFFEKIENMVLELKSSYPQSFHYAASEPKALGTKAIDDFNDRYNFRPPPVAGSCGLSEKGSPSFGSRISFTAPASFISGGEDRYGSLSFDCPHCGFKNQRTPGELIKTCQSDSCGRSVRC